MDYSVELARVAERAERYDEMADYMAQRVRSGVPLSHEERDMFSAAFKNSLTDRRQASRFIQQVIQQQETQNQKFAELAIGYRTKVEAELSMICEKALELLATVLVPGAQDCESQTFYLKMQGDYNRYLAEFAIREKKANATYAAQEAYLMGLEAAKPQGGGGLPSTHPVYLGLALNFSIFRHEVLGDTKAAMATAVDALTAAAADLDQVPTELREDAVLTMRLLQDNLELWEPLQQQ